MCFISIFLDLVFLLIHTFDCNEVIVKSLVRYFTQVHQGGKHILFYIDQNIEKLALIIDWGFLAYALGYDCIGLVY